MAYDQWTLYEEYQHNEQPTDIWEPWASGATMAQRIVEYPGVRGHSIMGEEANTTNHPHIRWISGGSVGNISLVCKFRPPAFMDDSDAQQNGVPAGTQCLKEGMEEINLRVAENKTTTIDYNYIKVAFSWDTLYLEKWFYNESTDLHQMVSQVTQPITVEYMQDMEQYYMLKININIDDIEVYFWQSINPEPSTPTISATIQGSSSGYITLKQGLVAKFDGYNVTNGTAYIFWESSTADINTSSYQSALVQGVIYYPDGTTPLDIPDIYVDAVDKWERFPHIDAPDWWDIICSQGSLDIETGEYSIYVEPSPIVHYITPQPRRLGYNPNEQVLEAGAGSTNTIDITILDLPTDIDTLDKLWQIRYGPTKTYHLLNDLDLTNYNFQYKADHLADYGNWIPARLATGSLKGWLASANENYPRNISNMVVNQITDTTLSIPIRRRDYKYNGFINQAGGDTQAGIIENINLLGATVTANTSYVGILAGAEIVFNISNCKVEGTINIENDYEDTNSCQFVGGVAGADLDTATQSLHEWNSVNVTINGTGIDDYVGGYFGRNYGIVKKAIVQGSITAYNSYYCGGFSGLDYGDISYSFTRIDVGGNIYAGGFFGYEMGTSLQCYSTGAVTGSTYVGGFAGYNGGTIDACYYDSQTSGRSDTGKGIPRTTEKMTKPYDEADTYVGWDWDIHWFIYYLANDGYPVFYPCWEAVGEGQGEYSLIEIFLWVKHNGIWEEARGYVKKDGSWHMVDSGFVKKEGVWN